MKNRLFVGLAFFSLVNFGRLVMASQEPNIVESQQLANQTSLRVQIVSVYDYPSDSTTNSYSPQDMKEPFLTLYKKEFKELDLPYTEGERLVRLTLENASTVQEEDIAQFIKNHSGANHFFLPANVVLDAKGQAKNFDLAISGNKQINFVIVDQIKDSKKSGYSIVKSFAGLNIAALLGFICWAYKNNVSSQDIQESLGVLLSKFYHIVR